jgi:perosamine synthetase
MPAKSIPVAAPVLEGNEEHYVLDCLRSSWISSKGKYIDRFEQAFAEYCQVRHAISCCNGTVALHVALLALGVGPGDEVIVPTLSYVATANAVSYCGAVPVLADVCPRTWNLDPEQIAARITPRTRGIVVVHLYGLPADMQAIRAVADRHGLFVLEDAAEAHGAEYQGQRVGGIGDAGTFSFYGNKIITTGEGGMVVTNDDALARKVRLLKGQGVDPQRTYWHPVIGYNYRMTNIAAAIGLAQLERIDELLARRLDVAAWYKDLLHGVRCLEIQQELPGARHVWWMFSVVLPAALAPQRDGLREHLQRLGIETRPVFYPMHVLPPYAQAMTPSAYPNADRIAEGGINLPTWPGMSREDVRFVVDALQAWLEQGREPKAVMSPAELACRE